MPQVGDKRYDKEREKVYKWIRCPHCGKERWVEAWHYRKYKNSDYCRSCAQKYHRKTPRGSAHPRWKGGRFTEKRGYVMVMVYPDDPLYPMANKNGYVLEHRLVVARALGRCLQPWEIVHHKEGIKNDNRYPEKLELTTRNNHKLNYRAGYEQGFRDGETLAKFQGEGEPRVKVEI